MGEPRLFAGNILSNGDFETGSYSPYTLGVDSGNQGSLATQALSGIAHGGTYYFTTAVDSTSGRDNITVIQNGISCTQSVNYQFEGWARIPGAAAKGIIISLANASDTSSNYGLSDVFTPDALAWQRMQGNFNAVATDASARLWMGVGANLEDISFDDLAIRPYVSLRPGYNYENAKVLQNRINHRTRSGGLYTYIGDGSHRRITLPLRWVTPLQRSIINSWWETGLDLTYAEDGDYMSRSGETVRIVGVEEPFQSFVAPYFQTQYAGEIILETT